MRKSLQSLWLIVGSVVLTSSVFAGTYEVANNTEAKLLKRRIRAAQFLNMATFGATEAEVDALAERFGQIGGKAARLEWIENQFDITPSLQKDIQLGMVASEGLPVDGQTPLGEGKYRQLGGWHAMIAGEDQLRQRMSWALSQIFVVNANIAGITNRSLLDGEPRWLGPAVYTDMLTNHAFGNYRDLLGDVTANPIMGVFLSALRNRKANPAQGLFPDENYAREVMQLFSIGLYELRLNGTFKRDPEGNPINTYDNEAIKAFARVFTGYNYARSTTPYNGARNYLEPMVLYDEVHDTDEKTLLKGTVLPAGQTAAQDISDGLDNLANHPNVGPFIARLLIQRLVKSNPSKGYIKRVAKKFNDNGEGVRGDFKAVITAILMDKGARRGIKLKTLRNPTRVQVTTTGGSLHSRLQEPVVRYAQFVRLFRGTSAHPGGYVALNGIGNQLGQIHWGSPSVFNFYLPDHQPTAEIAAFDAPKQIPQRVIYAPEFEIMTSVLANQLANRFTWDVSDREIDNGYTPPGFERVETTLQLDFTSEDALADTPAELVKHLDVLLCNGTMSDAFQQSLTAALEEETTDANTRVRAAILCTLNSPACAVSR